MRTLPILVASSLAAPAWVLAAPAGEVIALNGTAEYRESSTSPWKPLRLNQDVAPLAELRTGPFSSISLLLVDRSQIRLGQNTTFLLQAVAPAASAKPDRVGTLLRLIRGRVWAQIKQPVSPVTMTTPTVAAGIHGTDWVAAVDDAGTSTFTVLSGVIALQNDFGKLDVRAGEEGITEAGKAPVKRVLVNPQERVQWVADYTFDLRSYPELAHPALSSLNSLLKARKSAEALELLARQRGEAPSPLAWLIPAELELGRGEVAAARQWLEEGVRRYPEEPRFAVLQVRLALYQDDLSGAVSQAQAITSRYPSLLDAWLVLGEAARLAGNGPLARAAWLQATVLAPQDPRGWRGLGVVELERDATSAARGALGRARQQAGTPDYAAGELGTLLTYADLPTEAEAEFQKALAADPADYVALTGMGLAALKAGKDAAALDYLLRANAIEPRYARALSWLAVAYYRDGRSRAARDTLDRAALLDPNDPLPYILRGMIERDEREPAAALAAARNAAERMPKLKSLNQVASDRQGSANIGATLADMGLDAWANHYAQSAYYPYFAGSHLFLAERYTGNFNRTSELLQGFLVDPTVFGTDPKRDNLTVKPGAYGQIEALSLSSSQVKLHQYGAQTNGYANSVRPFAWFVQASDTRLRPDDRDDTVDSDNLAIGLGSKLTPELSVFAFGSRFRARSSLFSQEDRQEDTRLDAGVSYRLAPQSMLWLKAGWSELEQDRRDGEVSPFFTHAGPELKDIALRHTYTLSPSSELSYGASRAVRNSASTEAQAGRNRFESQDQQRDESSAVWLRGRQQLAAAWRLDAGLDWQRYEKTRDTQSQLITASGLVLPLDDSRNSLSRERVYPRLGMVYTPTPGIALRTAYQHWQKPYSNDSLAPVTTADIPLPDKLVLPGGELKQWRGQLDWELTPTLFLSAFHERNRMENVVFDPNGDVENQPTGVSQIDALLGNRLFEPGQVDGIAIAPIFRAGKIHTSGLQLNSMIAAHTAAYGSLLVNRSENTSVAFAGLPLPGIRKRNALAGITWAEGAWILNAEALYGSDYPEKENSGDLSRIEATRQFALRAGWRSDDRRWLIQAIARHTRGEDTNSTLFGLKGVLRF